MFLLSASSFSLSADSFACDFMYNSYNNLLSGDDQMKLKRFIVTFTAFVLTTGFLFLVGHLFTIPPFLFHHEYTDSTNGLFVTTGSILPLVIGLIVSFFAEKMYRNKYRQKFD
jgi:hypothetical protein